MFGLVVVLFYNSLLLYEFIFVFYLLFIAFNSINNLNGNNVLTGENSVYQSTRFKELKCGILIIKKK